MPTGIYPRTEFHNRRISEGNKGRIVSQETRNKISIANKGRVRSEEFRKKISILQRGKKRKLHTIEAKIKMSEGLRKAHQKNSNYGFQKGNQIGFKKGCMSLKGMLGKVPWNKGIKIDKEKYPQLSNGNFKKGHIPWNKKYKTKEEYYQAKLTLNRKRRHELGLSKRYIVKYGGIKIPAKVFRQRRKALIKRGGNLPIERIQMVYEDNIKQYGTLTCYLCLNPIQFGKDTLEHKQPLSRNGTNEYNNLAVACFKCNCKKNIKTEEEYKKEILLK